MFRRWFRLILNTVILIIVLNGALKAARMYITHPVAQATRVVRAAFELQQMATAVEREELTAGSYPENFSQFISAGTSEEYGNQTVFPIEESAHLHPNSRPFADFAWSQRSMR